MFRAYVPAYTASACIRIGNASQARAHRFPFATSSQMHVRVFLSPMRREGGGRRHKADQNNNTKERQRCEAMIKKSEKRRLAEEQEWGDYAQKSCSLAVLCRFQMISCRRHGVNVS